MLSETDYAANYNTPPMIAYRSTEQFKSYLTALDKWEVAKHAYAMTPNHETRMALHNTEKVMRSKLAITRSTPEHKAAFGW